MLEVVEPTYLRRLIETLEQLVLALQNITRVWIDDSSRLFVRVGYIDDGYVRVRDTSASIDILEMLREFSWVLFNLAEASKLLSNLKPAIGVPEIDLASYSIPGGGVVEVTKSNLDGWSALAVTVMATYASGATAGARVRWLYSANGVNYDSPEDAEAEGNYADLTFAAGATRQRTTLVPIFTPYVKIQVVNLDPTNTVVVTMWSLAMR